MVKLLRITKPLMPSSFAIILSVILLETFSFNTMQSIIPLLSTLNDPPAVLVKHKMVTDIPFIFTIVQLSTMLVGAIIVDLTNLGELILIFPLVLWIVIPIWLGAIGSKSFIFPMVLCMAILRGFIEPVILSIGAQVYNKNQLNKTYRYFMFTYCAYQVGSFGVQSLVPINIVENYICSNIDCLERAKLLTSMSAALASIIYFLNMKIFAIDKDVHAIDLETCKKKFYNILGLLFILIPYGVFWIFYQYIIPKVADLPKLTNLLIISINDVPRLYTALTVTFTLLYYYLVYKRFSKFILKNSNLLMTIGGILLGLWPIISAPMIFEHKDQYLEVEDPKPDAMQIMYLSMCHYGTMLSVAIDSPYYVRETLDCSIGYKINRDVPFLAVEGNACPKVWTTLSNSQPQCFKIGERYIIHLNSNGEIVTILSDRCVRDAYGMPLVCALLKNDDSPNEKLQLKYINVVGETEVLRYTFVNPDQPYTYSCHTVQPGFYVHRTTDADWSSLMWEFKAGGAYLLFTISRDYARNITKIKPFKSTILNTPLIPSYIIRAIGECLLVTNGFYFVYVRMHPKFRTIGIAIWFILMKYGFLIFENQRYNDIYYEWDNDLYNLGYILIAMPILSIIIQAIWKCQKKYKIESDTRAK